MLKAKTTLLIHSYSFKNSHKKKHVRITRCLEGSIMVLLFSQVRVVFKQMECNLFTLKLLSFSLPVAFASCMVFYVKMSMC